MSFWPFKIDKQQDYAYLMDAFTDDECDKIIKYGNSKELVVGAPTSDKIRKSMINFIEPNEDFDWVYMKLTDIIDYLNNDYFNFDLLGFGENIQFTKYEAPTGHYSWHRDKFLQKKIRKLSIVVQLSNEDDYIGGDLELKFGDEPDKMIRKRGTILCFPSHVLHRVTPVTEGTRYSLVAWVTGPQFK